MFSKTTHCTTSTDITVYASFFVTQQQSSVRSPFGWRSLCLSCLTFSDHITKLSQICYMHIRDLRRFRPILDYKTACTIATSIVHSKLDYCNSLFYSINSSQITRLQTIQNALA